ncbi:MAG TPA: hypothetical protein VE011_07435 [Candidatus Dormibacteraeota bacterium]|nr:hypothetical protein [Candidatus Dormibacteraeota bacterium]
MTARTSIRALALLASTLVAAACSGGGSTATNVAATQAAQATTTPVTQAPVATDAGNPTFALPSFHGNVDLEKLIPTSIGGEPLTTLSMTGDQFIGSGADSQLSAVLAALNKQPSDLSVAFGGNAKVTVTAFQVKGVSGSQILDAFYNASKSTLNANITDANIAGKAGKKVTPNDTTQAPSYIYTKDDVVFAIAGASGPLTDAQLTEVFQKLP